MSSNQLITTTAAGLYCEAGDFYIDPWQPVKRAVITHAHSDHLTDGSRKYLTTSSGAALLRARLGEDCSSSIETMDFGSKVDLGEVSVSFHPAGHVLGSAQVKLERRGEIWVVSGDYKRQPDRTCEPFELVRCHVFVTEATFGLPIFRWRPSESVLNEINEWWQSNKEQNKCSILFCYSLGKAQRILSGLDETIGPIYAHGGVERITEIYRNSAIKLPPTAHVRVLPSGTQFSGALILAPPSAQHSSWIRRFGPSVTGFASGWTRIRGTRRRKSIDRGFVLSDHADWEALNETIRATGADQIIVTHGYTSEMVRWLQEQGLNASSLTTKFTGELEELQPHEDLELASLADVPVQPVQITVEVKPDSNVQAPPITVSAEMDRSTQDSAREKKQLSCTLTADEQWVTQVKTLGRAVKENLSDESLH